MKKRTSFIILFLLTVMFLRSEILTGRVMDSKSLRAVPEVMVWIESEDIKVMTDREGRFVIRGIYQGSFELKARHLGFEDYSIALKIPHSEPLIIEMERKSFQIPGISLIETRAIDRKTPVASTNIGNEEIRTKLQGEDLPLVLDEIPGLTSYSESGSGAGYSYFKARGFDQRRIGVMINGIPLNDPEDHRVYWVDMPDFTESIQDIQFQHGIGVSRYGIASFGGSLNIQTSLPQTENPDQLFFQYGSFNTKKYGMIFNSELSDDFQLNIRLSKIISDGYRDNASSEHSAIYTSLGYQGFNSMTRFNFYTGHEITHAAWDASWEKDLNENHKHNPIEYENEIDDFQQPHIEFHNYYSPNKNLFIKNSLFYIKGNGFYEQLKEDSDLWEYGLSEEPEIEYADLIRQKWIKKYQYGLISSLSVKHGDGEFTFGTYLSNFSSDHWGEVDDVAGMETLAYQKDFVYHRYKGNKQYLTSYVNENYDLFGTINLMTNIHYQYIRYSFKQKEEGNFKGELLNEYDVDYSFFNPQVGINVNLNKHWNIFGNAAIAHREPADNELYDIWQGPDDLGVKPLFSKSSAIYDEDGEIKGYKWNDPIVEPEYVIDYECGIGFKNRNVNFKLNTYYMDFKNEIIDYGGVDDEGYAVRGNADATVHRGIELQMSSLLPLNCTLSATYAWSDNYFKNFSYVFYGEEIDLSGNQIGGYPQNAGQIKLLRQTGKQRAYLQMQYNGKQYLDNTQREEHIVDPFTVFNFGWDVEFKNLIGNSNLTIQLRLNNIFDLEYETAGYLDDADGDFVYEDNFFYPAAGQNFSAGLRLSF